MNYNGKILGKARAELSDIRDNNKKEHEKRLSVVYHNIPEIKDIDSKLAMQMPYLAKMIFSGSTDEVELLRQSNLDLQMKRAELLVSNGYPSDYLDTIYSCSICRDTGYNGQKVCSCLDTLYNRALTRSLSGLMKTGNESFETFDLTLYPAEDRDRMSKILFLCKEYAHYFPGVDNLLFIGPSGVGKTFLSACIAREVSKHGYSVVYDTASACLSAFERTPFFRDSDHEDTSAKIESILSCDLMIIDDLGTEYTTSSAMSALYTIINTRMINSKNTIINTNLGSDSLRKRYIEAICSRIDGSFTKLEFRGDDIRLKIKEVN